MTQNLSFRWLLPLTLSALVGAIAAGCGGSSVESKGATQRVKPGDTCSVPGQSAPADDGCNTCTCSSGTWACTEKACVTEDAGAPQACVVGTTRPAGDGCNTCTCSESGAWLCTLMACTTCKPGETTNDGCNSCTCVDGQFVCTNRACPPPPICKDGDVKQESCNTCTCTSGVWGCTKMACPPPQCTDGDTKYDGCNSCSCSGGLWACTARYCPPPPEDAGSAKKACGGWLGDTCTQDEYCAYTEGQMCGAADASSYCAPRPGACDAVYDPVCGCDNKTYGNACEGALARTGVLHQGVCP